MMPLLKIKRLPRRRRLFFGGIDAFAQFLARLEMRYVFRRHLDLVAGFGIAAGARRSEIQTETSKAAYLDPVPLRKTLAHGVQYHFHRQFGILRHQLVRDGKRAASFAINSDLVMMLPYC